ncbi:MAG TPA: hypothetical protein VEI52_26945, partial [Terriglobales bacterium]|nr:hypothetical protein [Terriglobales bacterium]
MEPLYYSAGWLKNRALDWLTFRALPPPIEGSASTVPAGWVAHNPIHVRAPGGKSQIVPSDLSPPFTPAQIREAY